MLIEGNSIRGVSRMTGASNNTNNKPLLDVAGACLDYQVWSARTSPRGCTCAGSPA